MADTTASSSQRMDAESQTDALYDQAVETSFGPSESGSAQSGETASDPSPADADSLLTDPSSSATKQDGSTPTHGVISSSTLRQKAEMSQMGELSILRIEQLRAENVELKAEGQRLRREMARLRERNIALERINYDLDEKVSQVTVSEKRMIELQRSAEYHRAARRSMHKEVRRLQESLTETDKRFAHTEAQLRAINQERADRITVLSEELKALQRGKAELEQQAESLLGYRQRAMSCLQQLTEELKRLRKENREKSRRLSEAQAILQGIDQRLAESITEPV